MIASSTDNAWPAAHAAAQVEVTFAGDIENITARAMAQRQVEPAIAGDNVLAE